MRYTSVQVAGGDGRCDHEPPPLKRGTLARQSDYHRMTDDKQPDMLAIRTPDYVASAAKAALGAVPFAGSLLSEIAGSIIPNQRIDRIVAFAEELESKLSQVDQRLMRAALANEHFTDLILGERSASSSTRLTSVSQRTIDE